MLYLDTCLLLAVLTPEAHTAAALTFLEQAPAPLADYPKQAITVVSPFPPGGGNDGVARLIEHHGLYRSHP